MNRKIAATVAVVCILAAIAAGGSIAYRVVRQGAAGAEVAEADFERLLSALAEVRTASDLADPALRGRLMAHFSACPTLLAVEVFERGVGTRWRIPADSPYALGISAELTKLPSSTLRLTSPLRSDTTGALAVDALYVRVTQLTVFTAFRDSLIALAAFLALASIILAIASRPRREEGPSAAAEEAASAAAAYQYETLSSGWGEPPAEAPAAPAAPAPRGPASAPRASAPALGRGAEDEGTAAPAARAQERPIEPEAQGRRETPEPDLPEFETPDFETPEFEIPEAPRAQGAAEFEPDYLEHAEQAEEDFFLAREDEGERRERPSKGFFEDEAEDEFDIPEIDFKEDDRPRPSAFEAKIDEPLPEMDMPSDDWMSAEAAHPAEATLPAEEAPESAAPGEAPSGGSESERAPDIEELAAFDLEEPLPAEADAGLSPEGRLAGRLATEIFQAASSGMDLSLVIIEHEELTPAVREYARFARAVKDHFDAGDLAFERGRSGFAVVLPGADSRRAVELADGFLKKLDFLSGGDSKELQFIPLFIGISSRAARPVAADRLIAETEAALRKAKEDSESHIVAFRPDPGRFKDFMASREG